MIHTVFWHNDTGHSVVYLRNNFFHVIDHVSSFMAVELKEKTLDRKKNELKRGKSFELFQNKQRLSLRGTLIVTGKNQPSLVEKPQ